MHTLRSLTNVCHVLPARRMSTATHSSCLRLQRVHDLLDAYMSTLRYDRHLKPLNLVVITDGLATDYIQGAPLLHGHSRFPRARYEPADRDLHIIVSSIRWLLRYHCHTSECASD